MPELRSQGKQARMDNWHKPVRWLRNGPCLNANAVVVCARVKLARYLLALFFVAAGAAHFVSPQPYLAILPPFVLWPAAMVYLSGIAEIVGGFGVLIGRERRAAGVGLIALLIVVFPANVYAALHGMIVAGWNVPGWLLWVRLPFQPLLVWWVYRACCKES